MIESCATAGALSGPVFRMGAGRWAVLLALTVPIAVLAIGAHDLALTRLGIPYPYGDAIPASVRLVGQAVRVGALVNLCRLAGGFLDRRPAPVAAAVMGVAYAALCESLRGVIIDDQIYGGGWGGPLLFSLTLHAPTGVVAFFQGCAAALVARRRPSGPFVLAAAVAAAAAGSLVVLPTAEAALALVARAAHLQPLSERYALPFDWRMYRYIYASFTESVLACLFLAAIVLPGLSGGRMRRVAAFTLLILFARGRVFATLIDPFWLRPPFLVAVAAEGQFFVETLILAALSALAWEVVARGPDAALDP